MHNNTKGKPAASGVIIYFNEEKTSSQVCRPSMKDFDGNWTRLAQHIAGNRSYHSFKVI